MHCIQGESLIGQWTSGEHLSLILSQSGAKGTHKLTGNRSPSMHPIGMKQEVVDLLLTHQHQTLD